MEREKAKELKRSECFRQFVDDYFGERFTVADMTDEEVVDMEDEYKHYLQWSKNR